jgi:hypothetical protein
MMRRATSAHTPLTLLATALLLAACGGPNLKPEQPGNINLAGAWRLSPAQSENPQALILQLQEKAMRRWQSADESPEFGGDFGPPESGSGAGESERGSSGATDARPPGNRRPRGGGFLVRRYGNALGSRLNGDSLVIEQSANRFVIIRGDSRTSYIPGARSVVGVADGVADQTSGWTGREYVIDVRPQVGPHLTERYGLSADGKLIERVTLTESDLPKLEFTRVYEAGAAPARGFPNSN